MPVDAAYVARLIDRHAAALRALAAQWSNAPEDLVQEAFCRLLSQPTLPGNPGGWLYAVVRNLARKGHQARRRRECRERRAATPEIGNCAPYDGAEAKEAVARLQDLEPDLREIVMMRLWGSLTFQDIAAACGISVATVHRRYYEALDSLRREMGISCATHPEDRKRDGT